jgi:hypothetical protein
MHGDPSIWRFFITKISRLNLTDFRPWHGRRPAARTGRVRTTGAVGALAAPAALPGSQQTRSPWQTARRGCGSASCHGADALRPLIQPCLRWRPAAIHAIPSRATREPVRRPLDSLAGQPISMVRLDAPDTSVSGARDARPSPGCRNGTGIHCSSRTWWHHVDTDPFNLLVNYWWMTHRRGTVAIRSVVSRAVSVHSLPPDKRAIWKKVFGTHFELTAARWLTAAGEAPLGTLDQRWRCTCSWLLRALTARR